MIFMIAQNKILILNDGNSIKNRKINYTKESIHHPSKMNIELCRWIITKFTKKEDIILDPMAGIFTTGIEGILLNRCVIGIEFEEEYVKWANDNLKRIKNNLGIETSYKNSYIKQWDAKNLSNIFHKKNFDIIIFSPPFINTSTGFNIKNKEKWMKFRMNKWYKDKLSKEALQKQTDEWTKKQYLSDDNIGKLPIDEYYDNMSKIYDECFKVLKNGGLMILVTKNPVKNGKQIELDKETIKMCEKSKFKLIDRYYKKLNNKGIWQRTYEIKWKEKYPKKKCPVSNYEDVLIFKKELQI